MGQVIAQCKSIVMTILRSAVAATITLFVAKFTVGLRVRESSADVGLDSSARGEPGYTF